MTIKAIETWYAGHNFRSRLEARWAVFFDALSIRWVYETQGYHVPWRLSQYDGTFRYLPDFFLPDLGVWFEVKGTLTMQECERLLNAAAALSSNNGGGCGHETGGHDLVLSGAIPRFLPEAAPCPTVTDTPFRLHMHKGDLRASTWYIGHKLTCSGDPIASDVGGAYESITAIARGQIDNRNLPGWLLLGDFWLRPSLQLQSAITAARSARFEHGQSGATR